MVWAARAPFWTCALDLLPAYDLLIMLNISQDKQVVVEIKTCVRLQHRLDALGVERNDVVENIVVGDAAAHTRSLFSTRPHVPHLPFVRVHR